MATAGLRAAQQDAGDGVDCRVEGQEPGQDDRPRHRGHQGPVGVEEVGSSYRDGDQGGQGEVGDAQTDRHDGPGAADQGVADPGAQDRHRQEGGCQGQPPVLAASPGFAGAVAPGQVDHYQDQGDGEKRQAHRGQGRRQWPGHRPEHVRRRLVGWQERTGCRGGSHHEHGGVEEDHGEQPAAQTRPEPALGEEQQRQGHDHVEQDPGALTGCGHVVGSGRRSRHVLRQHFGEQQCGVQTRQHQKQPSTPVPRSWATNTPAAAGTAPRITAAARISRCSR